jgi:hypothetical protein
MASSTVRAGLAIHRDVVRNNRMRLALDHLALELKRYALSTIREA